MPSLYPLDFPKLTKLTLTSSWSLIESIKEKFIFQLPKGWFSLGSQRSGQYGRAIHSTLQVEHTLYSCVRRYQWAGILFYKSGLTRFWMHHRRTSKCRLWLDKHLWNRVFDPSLGGYWILSKHFKKPNNIKKQKTKQCFSNEQQLCQFKILSTCHPNSEAKNNFSLTEMVSWHLQL